MTPPQHPWQLSATALAKQLQGGALSASAVVDSVLARIAEVNPRINALVESLDDEARAQAALADQVAARGQSLGPLHGVPVTIKINVDTAGRPTTDGVVAMKDALAQHDSPLVASLRQAGAIVVGRSNAPAMSLRWFCDNELHGRTLNPFDPAVTPGGSSGGAAAAVACGMGPIAHGNDYGGSIRYPAWACGVVGLRTTVGRIPSYKASAPNRIISNQQMSVQGPLTRTVADARLALAVMARGSALDPQWVPAPLAQPDAALPCRVALFRHWRGGRADASVLAALDRAAQWLQAAGYSVEEAEPPHFDEAADLHRQLVLRDLQRGGAAAVQRLGDAALKTSFAHYRHGLLPWGMDDYLEALARRFSIARDWALFFERYPLLLLPNSWQRPFPIDHDLQSQAQFEDLLQAQSPLLATALLGLPGLAVPTGMDAGLPAGVQLCGARFREDRLLAAGEVIERAAGHDVLNAWAAAEPQRAPAPAAQQNS